MIQKEICAFGTETFELKNIVLVNNKQFNSFF